MFIASTKPEPHQKVHVLPTLVDGFGRVHRSMRISVTDQCNIRCKYCMPLGNVSFLPHSKLLSFEKIVEVAAAAAGLGVIDFRLTGGEPLMRPRRLSSRTVGSSD